MSYHAVDWVKAAEYSWRQWLSTPLVQNLLKLQGEYAAAAAEARLAAGMAQLRTSSLLIGSGSLALTLIVPLAVWVGVFAAMGAPYAQARALVRNENFQSGFSRGFIMGLLKWDWQHAVQRFFRFGAGQINPFDESLSSELLTYPHRNLSGSITWNSPRLRIACEDPCLENSSPLG